MNFRYLCIMYFIFIIIFSAFFFIVFYYLPIEKKMYLITYKTFESRSMIISAKDEHQALKRFRREVKKTTYLTPSIISFKEI